MKITLRTKATYVTYTKSNKDSGYRIVGLSSLAIDVLNQAKEIHGNSEYVFAIFILSKKRLGNTQAALIWIVHHN